MQRGLYIDDNTHGAEHILYSVSLGNALTTAAVRPFFLGHPVENALLHSEVAVVLTGCKLGLDAKSVIILDFKILCGHDKLQFLGSVYIYVCFLFSL